MASENNCIFIGNATRDCEVKYLANGDPVANFSLAVNEAYTKKDGTKSEAVEYVNCTAFGKLADVCGQFIKKGQSVYITSRVKTDKYEKDGETRYSTKFIVSRMQLLGGKGEKPAGKPAGNFDDVEDDIPF